MISYIEVTIIYSCLMSVFSYLIVMKDSQLKMINYKIILIILLITIINSLLYNNRIIVYLFDLLMCISIFKYQLKNIVKFYLIRLFFMSINITLFDCLVINLQYFFYYDSILWAFGILIFLFITYIICLLFIDILNNSKLVVPFNLFIDNQKLNLFGFIDTGNNCLYQKKPVIFIDNKYWIRQKDSVIITCQTLNKTSDMLGYSAQIEINKHIHDVYVVYIGNLEYDCILNHQIV